MVDCILFTHGNLAKEVLNTVTIVVGEQKDIYALSNENYSLSSLKKKLTEVINKSESEDILIITELFGGSCWMSSSFVAKNIKTKNVRVLSGLNMPMVLSFITKKDKISFDELVKTVQEDAINSIRKL